MAAPKPAKGGQLVSYVIGPAAWVKRGPEVVTCYRAHGGQKYPYAYPLAGPVTGLPLTSETGDPWPHHRSIFFGCDKVNGVDFWSTNMGPGRLVSEGPAGENLDSGAVAITDACAWTRADGSVVMRDKRRIVVTAAEPGLVTLDWDIRWTAEEDVAIPKTNHSLFSIRAAHDLTPAGGGRLLNAAGKEGEKATFGEAAPWVGFHGERAGGVVEGVCLLDHPGNPWGLSPWFTRDYGFASPTPLYFRDGPWKLAAGKSVRLRYRVVGHVGTPEEAGVSALWKAWAG